VLSNEIYLSAKGGKFLSAPGMLAQSSQFQCKNLIGLNLVLMTTKSNSKTANFDFVSTRIITEWEVLWYNATSPVSSM
jgi:hypothetical protein